VEAEITNTLAKERDDAIHRLNAAMRARRYQQLMQAVAWLEDRTADVEASTATTRS
jgi:hypothetical protein